MLGRFETLWKGCRVLVWVMCVMRVGCDVCDMCDVEVELFGSGQRETGLVENI